MQAEEKENCKVLKDSRKVERKAGSGVVQQALLNQISQHLFVMFCCIMNMVSAKLKHPSMPKYSHSGTLTGDYILGLFFIAVFVCFLHFSGCVWVCICVTREGAAEKVKNKHPRTFTRPIRCVICLCQLLLLGDSVAVSRQPANT